MTKIMHLIECKEKLTQMRDPLFVINTSLEIIRQRSSDKTIAPEIQRIQLALSKIDQIMNNQISLSS